MYAIISADGRQYKVEEGQELEIDLRTASTGDEVKFDQVLGYSDGSAFQFGSPLLAGASVTAQVVGVAQGPKLVVQKFRRRKNSRRRTGHRQWYTKVLVTTISLPGQKKAEKKADQPAEEKK